MDEILKNKAYRILELFIDSPQNDFSLRGIARKLNISHATVIKYISILEDLKLIKKKEGALYPAYFANTENNKYRFYKKNHFIFKLTDSGLIEEIQKEALPSSIILFGSIAKGTYNEKSDIDIFVESEECKINLNKYEKILNKEINLLFEKFSKNLSKELRTNVINGTILYGFIK